MKNAESTKDIRSMIDALGKDDPFSLKGTICVQALEWCLSEIERLEKVVDRAGRLAMMDIPPDMAMVRSGLDSRIYRLLQRIKDQQEMIDSQDRLITEFTEIARKWGANV